MRARYPHAGRAARVGSRNLLCCSSSAAPCTAVAQRRDVGRCGVGARVGASPSSSARGRGGREECARRARRRREHDERSDGSRARVCGKTMGRGDRVDILGTKRKRAEREMRGRVQSLHARRSHRRDVDHASLINTSTTVLHHGFLRPFMNGSEVVYQLTRSVRLKESSGTATE